MENTDKNEKRKEYRLERIRHTMENRQHSYRIRLENRRRKNREEKEKDVKIQEQREVYKNTASERKDKLETSPQKEQREKIKDTSIELEKEQKIWKAAIPKKIKEGLPEDKSKLEKEKLSGWKKGSKKREIECEKQTAGSFEKQGKSKCRETVQTKKEIGIHIEKPLETEKPFKKKEKENTSFLKVEEKNKIEEQKEPYEKPEARAKIQISLRQSQKNIGNQTESKKSGRGKSRFFIAAAVIFFLGIGGKLFYSYWQTTGNQFVFFVFAEKTPFYLYGENGEAKEEIYRRYKKEDKNFIGFLSFEKMNVSYPVRIPADTEPQYENSILYTEKDFNEMKEKGEVYLDGSALSEETSRAVIDAFQQTKQEKDFILTLDTETLHEKYEAVFLTQREKTGDYMVRMDTVYHFYEDIGEIEKEARYHSGRLFRFGDKILIVTLKDADSEKKYQLFARKLVY